MTRRSCSVALPEDRGEFAALMWEAVLDDRTREAILTGALARADQRRLPDPTGEAGPGRRRLRLASAGRQPPAVVVHRQRRVPAGPARAGPPAGRRVRDVAGAGWPPCGGCVTKSPSEGLGVNGAIRSGHVVQH